MIDVFFVVSGIWLIWVGIRHLQSEEFARTFLGGYRKSEDGRYPGNWRIWVGLVCAGIGTIVLLGGLANLGVL
jgi:hypothetical protein